MDGLYECIINDKLELLIERQPLTLFLYERILVTLTVCATLAAVVSCEYDSPEIRFQQTTTFTNDYSKVIDALRDQTLTISQKMDLLADAMKNQTLTLSEKMSLWKSS